MDTVRALMAGTLLGGTLAPSVALAQQGIDDPHDSDAGPDEIQVTGVRSLTSDKIPEGVPKAPQSISVVGHDLLEQQATSRLADALRNVPGITLNAGEGAARGDTVNLRGFPAFNDFFLDGVRDAALERLVEDRHLAALELGAQPTQLVCPEHLEGEVVATGVLGLDQDELVVALVAGEVGGATVALALAQSEDALGKGNGAVDVRDPQTDMADSGNHSYASSAPAEAGVGALPTGSAIALRIVPIRSISTSTTSPGWSNSCGSRDTPTPAGVPVAMMSPGSSVISAETNSIVVATSKIMFAVVPS